MSNGERTDPLDSKRLLLAIVAILSCTIGAWWAVRVVSTGSAGTTVSLQSGVQFVPARELADFALTDTENTPFTRQSLQGHWTLLTFGYTSCPDVCPTILHTLANLQQRMRKRDVNDASLRFVFVSVDPERDSLAHLREYVQFFSPSFLGATGTQAALQPLTSQMGVFYQRIAQGTTYVIDHSAVVFLLDPLAHISAFFEPPQEAEKMEADLIVLLGKG